MKNKMNLLICSLIITCGLFVYLTVHHYAVQLGLNGPALCDLGAKFNCDAAALSRYAEIWKIPVAVLGLCFNLILLGTVLFKKWGWSDEDETQNFVVRGLFVAASLVSLIMALISAISIKVMCPFCIGTYIFTFINTYLAWYVFSPADRDFFKVLSAKGILVMLAAIPILAWFISGSIQNNYGLDKIKELASQKVLEWENSKIFSFDDSLGLTRGPATARASIIEFADFKCPHCKAASQTIHKFMKSDTEARFIFKPFPLDGSCNPEIPSKGDGSRCKMATWTLCAEKISKQGWKVHDWYFEHQERLFSVSDLTEENKEVARQLNLNYEDIEKCSESVDIYESIKRMSSEAKAAGVEGTPTIFVNHKKLGMGQFTEVLKTAMESLK